jgi:hypothetical protein
MNLFEKKLCILRSYAISDKKCLSKRRFFGEIE